ncbi:MAG: hypothetical protein ACRD2R_09060 [Terriglobales bacterium]
MNSHTLLRLLFATIILAGITTAAAPAAPTSGSTATRVAPFSDGGAPLPLCRPSPTCKPMNK